MKKISLSLVFLMSLHADSNSLDLPMQDTIVGLAAQLGHFHQQECALNVPLQETLCVGTLSTLTHAHAVTVEDFEKTVYKKIQFMDSCHYEDQFAVWMRICGYVKGFIKALKKYGAEFVNHDAIIYDTTAVKWSEYSNFILDGPEDITCSIIRNIQTAYRNTK